MSRQFLMSTCSHPTWVDLGPELVQLGRVRCMRCDQVLDYYGDPDGPVGTVHRFPDVSMALAIVAFLRPHMDAIAEEIAEDSRPEWRPDLYGMLVDRLTAYFADRPENPFKPTVQP
jgi:hypothetical protein